MTRLFPHQLAHEQRVFWRNRESAIFIFIFPVMLFLLLGSVYGNEIDGQPAAVVLLAGMLGYGAANTGFAGIAITLVVRREAGILKRLRATPLPPATYVAATLCSTLIVFSLQAVTLFGIGRLLFDTPFPERIFSMIAVVFFGAAAFCGIGLAAASLIRSAEGSSAVVNVILLPMAFLSGSFGPQGYPGVLEAIGDVLPLKYYIDVVKGVYLGGEHIWEEPRALAVVAAWGIGGLLVAARRFSWEPRER